MLSRKPPCPQVRLALEVMFEGAQGTAEMGGISGDGQGTLRVADSVAVSFITQQPGGAQHAVLEWSGGPEADMVADAVVAVILQAAGQPPGLADVELQRLKAIRAGDVAAVEAAELGITTQLLGAQFGPARVDTEQVRARGASTATRAIAALSDSSCPAAALPRARASEACPSKLTPTTPPPRTRGRPCRASSLWTWTARTS